MKVLNKRRIDNSFFFLNGYLMCYEIVPKPIIVKPLWRIFDMKFKVQNNIIVPKQFFFAIQCMDIHYFILHCSTSKQILVNKTKV